MSRRSSPTLDSGPQSGVHASGPELQSAAPVQPVGVHGSGSELDRAPPGREKCWAPNRVQRPGPNAGTAINVRTEILPCMTIVPDSALTSQRLVVGRDTRGPAHHMIAAAWTSELAWGPQAPAGCRNV
jgi:hypothetical protein